MLLTSKFKGTSTFSPIPMKDDSSEGEILPLSLISGGVAILTMTRKHFQYFDGLILWKVSVKLRHLKRHLQVMKGGSSQFGGSSHRTGFVSCSLFFTSGPPPLRFPSIHSKSKLGSFLIFICFLFWRGSQVNCHLMQKLSELRTVSSLHDQSL